MTKTVLKKMFRPGCMVTVLKEAGRPQAVTQLLGDCSAGLRCAAREALGWGGGR